MKNAVLFFIFYQIAGNDGSMVMNRNTNLTNNKYDQQKDRTDTMKFIFIHLFFYYQKPKTEF